MPAQPATPAPAAAAYDAAVLLSADSFFVRRVPLDPAGDAATQAELALESSAPFAVAQLYYGYLVAPDGQSALIFATHRRLFAQESWDGASVVLPNFVALLGEAPNRPKLRIWRDAGAIVVTGWDGGALPAAVLARRPEAGDSDDGSALIAEARRRLGFGDDVELEEFSGPIHSETEKGEQLFSIAGVRTITARFAAGQLSAMDVRDKAVLAERRANEKRDSLLWRVLLTAIGGIAFAFLLEGGMLAGRLLLNRQRDVQRTLAAEVTKIQTAQTLGARIEEMSQRRLRAFEMLAVINQVRPNGLLFTRSVTNGRDTLEIEGQSPNSDNVGAYESALRGLPQVASVEFPDVRLREGVTTFQCTVRFKEGVLSSAAVATPGGSK